MAELYHITDRASWVQSTQTGEYRISTRDITLEDQGFIHCSLRDQLSTVAELVYGDADDAELVVLVIDSARVPAELRYEAAEPAGEEFPHIYGPLPVSAVTNVIAFSRDSDGNVIVPR